MKKVMVFCIALCLIHSAAALTLSVKDAYAPSETLIAEVQGTLTEPLREDQVELYRGTVQVPFEYSVQRLQDRTFLSAVLPRAAMNYTLVLRDVRTVVEGRQETVTLEQPLQVAGELVPYYITAGALEARADFEVIVISNANGPRDISIGGPGEHNATLQPGENRIPFQLAEFEPGFTTLEIGMYDVQVFAVKPAAPAPVAQLRWIPQTLDVILLRGSTQNFSLTLVNVGQVASQSAPFIYNTELFTVVPSAAPVLQPNASLQVNLTVKRANQTIYNESLRVQQGSSLTDLALFFTVTENQSAVTNVSEIQNSLRPFCSEMQGKICISNEVCSGSTLQARDGVCCVGVCLAPEESGGYSWIGYLLGTSILIALVFLLFRYMKSKNRKVNPLSAHLKTE